MGFGAEIEMFLEPKKATHAPAVRVPPTAPPWPAKP
jgi:hypothetical protein